MLVTLPKLLLENLIAGYVQAWSDTTPNASIRAVFEQTLIRAASEVTFRSVIVRGPMAYSWVTGQLEKALAARDDPAAEKTEG